MIERLKEILSKLELRVYTVVVMAQRDLEKGELDEHRHARVIEREGASDLSGCCQDSRGKLAIGESLWEV